MLHTVMKEALQIASTALKKNRTVPRPLVFGSRKTRWSFFCLPENITRPEDMLEFLKLTANSIPWDALVILSDACFFAYLADGPSPGHYCDPSRGVATMILSPDGSYVAKAVMPEGEEEPVRFREWLPLSGGRYNEIIKARRNGARKEVVAQCRI